MVERSETVGRRFEPKHGRGEHSLENGCMPSPQQLSVVNSIIETTPNCDLEHIRRAGEILFSVAMRNG